MTEKYKMNFVTGKEQTSNDVISKVNLFLDLSSRCMYSNVHSQYYSVPNRFVLQYAFLLCTLNVWLPLSSGPGRIL